MFPSHRRGLTAGGMYVLKMINGNEKLFPLPYVLSRFYWWTCKNLSSLCAEITAAAILIDCWCCSVRSKPLDWLVQRKSFYSCSPGEEKSRTKSKQNTTGIDVPLKSASTAKKLLNNVVLIESFLSVQWWKLRWTALDKTWDALFHFFNENLDSRVMMSYFFASAISTSVCFQFKP